MENTKDLTPEQLAELDKLPPWYVNPATGLLVGAKLKDIKAHSEKLEAKEKLEALEKESKRLWQEMQGHPTEAEKALVGCTLKEIGEHAKRQLEYTEAQEHKS